RGGEGQGEEQRKHHCRSAFRSTQLRPSGKRNFVTVSTLSLEPLNHPSCSQSTPCGNSTLASTALPDEPSRTGRIARAANPSPSGTYRVECTSLSGGSPRYRRTMLYTPGRAFRSQNTSDGPVLDGRETAASPIGWATSSRLSGRARQSAL